MIYSRRVWKERRARNFESFSAPITLGHHSLLLRLLKSGAVILSGDVAHFQVNHEKALVPIGNISRAEMIARVAA